MITVSKVTLFIIVLLFSEPSKLSVNLPVITRTAATPVHTPSPVQKQLKQATEKQHHQVVNSCDLSACLEDARMAENVQLNDLRFIDSSTHSASSPNRTSVCVSFYLIKINITIICVRKQLYICLNLVSFQVKTAYVFLLHLILVLQKYKTFIITFYTIAIKDYKIRKI